MTRTNGNTAGIAIVTRTLQISAIALGVLALGTSQSRAVPLSDLLAGGSITCLDKTFSNFHAFNNVNAGGAVGPTAAQVDISADPSTCGPGASPLAVPGPGLLIQSAQWNVNANQSIDTAFSYDVTSSAGLSIHDADLILESFVADGGADIHITESLFGTAGLITSLGVDTLTGPITDHHDFAPVTFLTVNKDISLDGHAAGSASLSTFRQDFSQVPEPASLAIVGFGLIGLGWLRRRRIG